jgi:hypothetical protein
MRYYVDTCIYINLLQKEESAGKQFWKMALDFFSKTPKENIYHLDLLSKNSNIFSKKSMGLTGISLNSSRESQRTMLMIMKLAFLRK